MTVHAAATPGWFKRAACVGLDPDIFHPAAGGRYVYANAKRVCATCPVTAECLEHALTHNETLGVWGGLNPLQRQQLTPNTNQRTSQ